MLWRDGHILGPRLVHGNWGNEFATHSPFYAK